MTRREARVIYRQCYLPKVTYPLPATTMSLDKIYKTQLQVTAQFLNKMGYPVTFPRAVVYAPCDVGGLGFRHLGHEQGVQHVLQLLKHLRTSTLNGQLYSALIDAYQIRAGCARHILEYTETLPWCLNGWLTTTRQFLNNINMTITLHHPWVPLPRRVNDQNIMDDVIRIMPNANTDAINNVRLYLRVFFLSEITEANGFTVLPDILQPSPRHSGSSVQWPRQPMPPPEAWRHWKRAIQTMYLCTNSDWLINPLKEWTEHVNTDWEWEWRLNPTTLELYQRSGEHWYRRRPAIHQRTYISYDIQGQHRVRLDPTMLPPATPSFDASQQYITVQLPVATIKLAAPIIYPVFTDLLDRLCTPPLPWADSLWHRIRPTAPVDAMLYHIQRRNTLILSSDASVDGAQHSCCAWSLHGDVTLWQGEGIVPGNCDDTYSGRSEAFGLLTALLFLQHYLQQFPLTQSAMQTPLMVYCDNGGTITNASAHSKQTELFPNRSISNDYDVYHEIGHVVGRLTQFSIVFAHVKGHQNKTTWKKSLSLPAQLNIECDERANRFISHARRMRQQDNPELPNAYPHLRIHGRVIVRELPQALRHAAQTPDYRDYLKEKFHWHDKECDDINWTALKFALRKLSPADTIRAHKFLHDWLPLKGAPHTSNPTASKVCPQCWWEDETIWHFWECPHVEQEQRYRKLQAALQALHTQNHIDPHLFQLLWQGLQAIRTDTPIDEQYEGYPDDIKPLFQAQLKIGWDQLYYGRISSTWAHYVTTNSQYQLNGTRFYTQVIGLVWEYMFDCWNQRNHHLHSTDTLPPDFQALEAQVRQIVETAHNDPALEHIAPTHTADQILQQPIPRIRGWAQHGAQHLQNALTAVHKRAVLHTYDFRNFFKPRSNPDLRPP